MAQRSAVEVTAAQLATLDRVVRGLVRKLRRLAAAAVGGAVPIAVLLERDGGFSGGDAVFVVLLLAPPAFLLFFAAGVHELVSLPDRLLRLPSEGRDRVTELARVAGGARTARLRSLPLLIWRLRSSFGSVRSVAGIALPLRVVTPGFLGLAALAALVCLVTACSGVIALLVLAFG
jgi:hypothetical protein